MDALPLTIELDSSSVASSPKGIIEGKSARIRSRHRKAKLRKELTRDMIGALNTLYGAKPVGEPCGEPNLVRQSVLQHLCDLGEDVCRRGLGRSAATNIRGDRTSYEQGNCEGLQLEVDKVSLPLNAVAGTANMLDLLPEPERTLYSSGKNVLLSCDEVPQQRRVWKGVATGQYECLIEKLRSNGIVGLRRERPKVINGIFGVPKQDKQRLIIDARNANAHFVTPANPDLPNPGMFTGMIAERGTKLFFTKSDMDNFYHRLRLPDWLTDYFGLPSVTTSEGRMYPVVLTVPMG